MGRVCRGGRVLDLAAGSGRHSRLLAQAGFHVLAVDRDQDALAQCGASEMRVLDLETSDWPLAGDQFDGIVVTNYLYRPHLPDLIGCLGPDGVLIYETFAIGQELFGRPRRPEFLLQPGELLSLCKDLFVLAYEDGVVERESRARVQRICALKRHPATAGAAILL